MTTETQTLNLSKGEFVYLEKQANKPLNKVNIGLGWDFTDGNVVDLDASAILYNSGNTKIGHCFFNEKNYGNGAVVLDGDNRTGEGDGDDETISVDFTKLPADVSKILFTITNFTGQALSVVKNAFARAVDAETGNELARYTLNEFGANTALYMVLLERTSEGFTLKAIGAPTDGKTFNDLVPGAAAHL